MNPLELVPAVFPFLIGCALIGAIWAIVVLRRPGIQKGEQQLRDALRRLGIDPGKLAGAVVTPAPVSVAQPSVAVVPPAAVAPADPGPVAPAGAAGTPVVPPAAPAKETAAQWVMRVHPEAANILPSVLAAFGRLADSLTYEEKWLAMSAPQAPAAPNPGFVAATPDAQLAPLTGELDAMGRAQATGQPWGDLGGSDVYRAWQQALDQAGYSLADRAGYLHAYGVGGRWGPSAAR